MTTFVTSSRCRSRCGRRRPKRSSTSSGIRRPMLPCIVLHALLHLLPASNTDQFVLVSASSAASHVPFGFQLSGSDPSDNLLGDGDGADGADTTYYAGDLRYDSASGVLYVAGAAYSSEFIDDDGSSSDCFVAALSLPGRGGSAGRRSGIADGDDDAAEQKQQRPSLLFSRRFGAADGVAESCSAIVSLPTLVASYETDGNNDDRGDAHYSSRLVALGRSDEDGLMTDLRDEGTDRAEVYGLALDLELSYETAGTAASTTTTTTTTTRGDGPQDLRPTGANLVGGRLFHDSLEQYPVAIAMQPRNSHIIGGGEEEFYVVMQSSDEEMSNDNNNNSKFGFGKKEEAEDQEEEQTADEKPDTTIPEGTKTVTIKKVGWKSERVDHEQAKHEVSTGTPDADAENKSTIGAAPERETMLDHWTQEYSSLDGTAVRASSLLYVPQINLREDGKKSRDGFLLFAGSTRGFGTAFGTAEADGTYDTDGFVTKLDRDTGLVLEKEPDGGGDRDAAAAAASSIRIHFRVGRNEVVRGVCIDEGSDDVREAFVVGSTTGDSGSNEMFVLRLDLDSMGMTWRRQRGSVGGQAVYATGCAVSGGGVYVGGVVEDSGVLGGGGIGGGMPAEDDSEPLRTAGGDDVFVMRFGASEGRLDFARQIGTQYDDRLATGGGVAVDEYGDAIICGTTWGGLMRRRGDGDEVSKNGEPPLPRTAEFFVMSISKTGQALPSISALTGGTSFGISADPSACVAPSSMLLLVLVTVLGSGPCACLLAMALRRRQAVSRLLRRYIDKGHPTTGTIDKREKNEARRTIPSFSRCIWVHYVTPSGTKITKKQFVSKQIYFGTRRGDMVNLVVLPGHEKSGIILREFQNDLSRSWGTIALVSIPCVVAVGACVLFALCLPWYGWIITVTVPILMGAIAWGLSPGTSTMLEETLVYGKRGFTSEQEDAEPVDQSATTNTNGSQVDLFAENEVDVI